VCAQTCNVTVRCMLPQIAMDAMLQPISEQCGTVAEHHLPPRLTFSMRSLTMAEVQIRLVDSSAASHTAHLRLLAPNVIEHVMETILVLVLAVVAAQATVAEMTLEAQAVWRQWWVRLIRGCQGTRCICMDRIVCFLSWLLFGGYRPIWKVIWYVGIIVNVVYSWCVCVWSTCTRSYCTVASFGAAPQVW
jgi:hypothetical protein